MCVEWMDNAWVVNWGCCMADACCSARGNQLARATSQCIREVPVMCPRIIFTRPEALGDRQICPSSVLGCHSADLQPKVVRDPVYSTARSTVVFFPLRYTNRSERTCIVLMCIPSFSPPFVLPRWPTSPPGCRRVRLAWDPGGRTCCEWGAEQAYRVRHIRGGNGIQSVMGTTGRSLTSPSRPAGPGQHRPPAQHAPDALPHCP